MTAYWLQNIYFSCLNNYNQAPDFPSEIPRPSGKLTRADATAVTVSTLYLIGFYKTFPGRWGFCLDSGSLWTSAQNLLRSSSIGFWLNRQLRVAPTHTQKHTGRPAATWDNVSHQTSVHLLFNITYSFKDTEPKRYKKTRFQLNEFFPITTQH